VWRDASPSRAAPEPDTGAAGSPTETIDAAERAIAAGADAWYVRLAADVRVHRQGTMPIVGRESVAAWAPKAFRSIAYSLVRSEVAGSGDLAVTIGGYDATTVVGVGGAERGSWVRVWKRDVTGRWRIVFETSKAAT